MGIHNSNIEYHEAFIIKDRGGSPVLQNTADNRTVAFDSYDDARDAAMEVACPSFTVDKVFVTAREWNRLFITHEAYEDMRDAVAVLSGRGLATLQAERDMLGTTTVGRSGY